MTSYFIGGIILQGEKNRIIDDLYFQIHLQKI